MPPFVQQRALDVAGERVPRRRLRRGASWPSRWTAPRGTAPGSSGERDIRRDALLATVGWQTLRFGYRRLTHDAPRRAGAEIRAHATPLAGGSWASTVCADRQAPDRDSWRPALTRCRRATRAPGRGRRRRSAGRRRPRRSAPRSGPASVRSARTASTSATCRPARSRSPSATSARIDSWRPTSPCAPPASASAAAVTTAGSPPVGSSAADRPRARGAPSRSCHHDQTSSVTNGSTGANSRSCTDSASASVAWADSAAGVGARRPATSPARRSRRRTTRRTTR